MLGGGVVVIVPVLAKNPTPWKTNLKCGDDCGYANKLTPRTLNFLDKLAERQVWSVELQRSISDTVTAVC